MSTHRNLRLLLGFLPAMAMIVGVLGPATAQAAHRPPPAHRPLRTAILRWAPGYKSFDVADGQRHEFFFTARFYSGTMLHNASFHIAIPGAIYAQPSTIWLGTVQARTWNDVAFTLVVPAGVAPGLHMGTLRLDTREGRRDFDVVGAPLTFGVIVRRQPPAPQASVAWQPGNGLGTLSLLPGQTLTETVTFSSNLPLTNAHLQADLGNYAQANGVSIALPVIASTLPANTPIAVTFTIGAGTNALPGAYDANLHIMGSAIGGAAVPLNANLTFRIQVQAPVVTPSMIYWSNVPGAVSLQPGQTVTVTAAFSSATVLNGAAVMSALSGSLLGPGMTIGVVATNVPATVTPGMVVPVSVAITAAPGATAGSGTATLNVVARNAANVGTQMPGTLSFPVAIVAPQVTSISWPSGPSVAFPSVTRSATTVSFSEQVTFVSSSTLTNAQLVTTIQPSQSGGPTIVPVQLPANTTIPANTPTKVSVIVSVPPTAQAGLYTGEVYVTAIAAGVTTAAPINTALVYTIAVN